MKKLIITIPFLISLGTAAELNLTKGWQLIGAYEDISVSSLNVPQISSVWGYDKIKHIWKVYVVNNPQFMNNLPWWAEPMEITIKKGEGFWVYANDDVNITAYNEENVTENVVAEINSSEYVPLSSKEIEGIVKLREEEKLARDVYITLYEKWNLKIFSNIAKSEQNHMNALKSLIDKYQIDDPVVNDEVGLFSNENMAALYQKLIQQGSNSVEDALKIGAEIEDMDIYDLQKEMQDVNDEIKKVYLFLQNGSKNHLRAFVRWLKTYNDEYVPQYISQELYQEILSN